MNDLSEKTESPAGNTEERALQQDDVGSNEPIEDSASLLISIGRQLRQAREAQGKQISDIVRELKLRKVYLEAMENGDWDILPDEVYAIGFLRQYASHLQLDLDADVNKIRNRHYELTRPLTFPDPPVAPSRRWAWLAAAVFLILFLAFNVLNNDTEEVAPSIPLVSVAPPAAEPEAVPPPEMNSSAVPMADVPAHAKINAATPATDQPGKSMDTAAPTDQMAAPPSGAIHSFRFEAVNDSVWLQVYLPDASGNSMGELRKEVLLNPGYHLTLDEPFNSLWITTGNAGALQIRIDDKLVNEAGSLGDIGAVLRNYQINAK